MNFKNQRFNVQGSIDCEIDHPKFGWIPFTADPNDPEQHGRDIYTQILEEGNILPFIPPDDITGEDALNIIRSKRDNILTNDIDPIVTNPLRWADLTIEEQTTWADYRKELLDITETFQNVLYIWDSETKNMKETNIVWPAKPN